MGSEYPLLIGGKEMVVERKFEVRVPFDTSMKLGTFQLAGEEEVKGAIDEAWEVHRWWRDWDWRERVELAFRAAEIASALKFRLAAQITFENGKNRFEAVAEVDETIDYFRYYAHLFQENRGYVREMESRLYKGEHPYSVMRPYGVWAVISPFNFPLAITATMTLGAVLTGNTAVLKPSSDTPLSAFSLVKIMDEAGFPKGVVNYVTSGGADFASFITRDPKVAGLAFTGSREVGHSLAKDFISSQPRPVVMELGGKNAVVVTAKADLKKAVEGIVRGAFGYGGQKCSATSRVYVHRDVYGRFLDGLVKRIGEVKVGDPTVRDTFMGPLINREAVRKFKAFVEEIRRAGGEILSGGKVIEEERSYTVEPTVAVNVPRDHWLWRRELFVPILLVDSISSLEEGIEMANDSEYGLTAGIFSEDREEIETFFRRIEAGVIYANRTVGSTTGAMPGVQPFGGWKHSGWTGKNAGGPYYLLSFLREQSRTWYE